MDDSIRCTARSKQSGERCKRARAKGALVCAMHGGKAPQVKRKAKERVVKQQALATAQRMVQLAGVDMDPIQHLLESLHMAHQLVRVWGVMVADLDDAAEREARGQGKIRGELSYDVAPADSFDDLRVTTSDHLIGFNYRGEAQVHPYVTEYQQAIERRAKFAKLCLDAGIAERQVRMVEAQVELVHRAFEAALEAAKLSAEQRQEARQTYARQLRAA
jgi:hypothetical protein